MSPLLAFPFSLKLASSGKSRFTPPEADIKVQSPFRADMETVNSPEDKSPFKGPS